MIPINLFCQVGNSLYGESWRMHLAHELAVQPRTLHYMTIGKRVIPASIAPALVTLIEKEPVDETRARLVEQLRAIAVDG